MHEDVLIGMQTREISSGRLIPDGLIKKEKGRKKEFFLQVQSRDDQLAAFCAY